MSEGPSMAGSEPGSGRSSADSGEPAEYFIDIDPRSLRYSSSNSSCCDPGESTAISTPGSSKPHKANNDAGWEAIRSLNSPGRLGFSHFRIMHRLGRGDIGSVYLAELKGSGFCFALKVMDKKGLSSRNKVLRAETEKVILQMLDHPFLPTLYAHIDAVQFSCLVMEFCPGGDLHVLRQLQPGKRFADHAARFYASEVLLALEYLHMMGIVYRDLKPENVLVRDDGHIMLTDFDLSLKSTVRPTLLRTSETPYTITASTSIGGGAACILPACVLPCTVMGATAPHQRQRVVSCLPMFPRKKNSKPKKTKMTKMGFNYHHAGDSSPSIALPELVAEPTEARSMSFVGTHEYLAPEIVLGDGHGNAVDWWTFGIFLFELLYGRTPFRGLDNEKTLVNVVSQPLRFPEAEEKERPGILPPPPSMAAKDLIRSLLVKDPTKRLGSTRGATEIKQHAFFHGVNWALIRCSIPPHIPSPFSVPTCSSPPSEKNSNSSDFEYF
ncbi:hypothetical protein SUGI_0915610 [Cryptomeria japonica]|uniref:serine/threonine-protein kinase D6PKL1 n=1 Tax=Cryptomeria japonica TaxID=3369 RepID=UPI002414C0AA|nr:serine/threonine-protein kinase D6PKL1 [Cryptomeria japonica]GLJ43920.1 hypothetical protein SUGI_0915610 [Cryptomeria japonica]